MVLGFALTGLAAAMLTIPATAFAGHDERRSRTEDRDGDRDDRADHRDRDGDRAHQRDSDRDHRRDSRYTTDRNRHRHSQKARHHNHGHKYGHSYKARYDRHNHRPAHSYRQASAKRHNAPYRCEPCNRRFNSRSGFHGHLSGNHHIPPWRLPFVIVHHTLGWVFFG